MSGRPPPKHKTSVLHVALTRVAAIGVLLGLSLVTWAYRRALEPQYGSSPTSLHLTKIVWSASILGSFAPTVPISRATLGLACLLYALPTAAYWVAAYTARFHDPVWGPVATHLIVLLPTLSLGVAIVKALQEAPYSKDDATAPQSSITLPVCATAINALQGLWPAASILAAMPAANIVLQTGTACMSAWAISPFLPNVYPPTPVAASPAAIPPTPDSKGKKKKKDVTEKPRPTASTPPPRPKSDNAGLARVRMALIPVLPFLTSTILRAPTLQHPLLKPYDHPSFPLRILSSVESTYSGIVVVGETTASEMDALDGINHMRYLRAGHSLLGGVWVGPKAVAFEGTLLEDESGEKLGDSIYSAFVLQEAALLAKKQHNTKPKNALMIGLGIGVSANAFMRHGVSTTIIEIDPVVYEAAHRFFGLPHDPSQVFLRDARGWVRNQSAIATAESTDKTAPLYDFVVHDCFSGGGIPAHLYTQQFWKDLKNIVTPDAVIAVNFAGILETDSARALILTLKSVFPQCRAFYDSLATPANITTEFQNWVFFCTPSSDPLEFRKAQNSDYLGSHLRRHVLSDLSSRESDISAVGEDLSQEKREQLVLREAANPLGEWQQKEAIHHWKIMRTVLPDVFWETY